MAAHALDAPAGDIAALHRAYRAHGDPALRDRLLGHYAGLVHALVSRTRLEEDREDATQVGLLALARALDRFDPDRGVRFATFAWVTVQGELKRFQRDTRWRLRVPRSLQEAYLHCMAVHDALHEELGAAPTVGQVAERTGLDPEDVVAALDAGTALRPASLDALAGAVPHAAFEPAAAGDVAGDAGERADVDRLLGLLPRRERAVVELRYFDELTQSEIGTRLGLSQAHVSRLLHRALTTLRDRAPAEVGCRA